MKDRLRRLKPRHEIVAEGKTPGHIVFLLSGWACRCKNLKDGRRQTMAYLLDGDLSDMSLLGRIDHSIETVTAATVAEVPRDAMLELKERSPGLTAALRRLELVGEAIALEWIVSLGQRTAQERLAHLFCEIFTRCRSVGLARDNGCPMPLTQTELASAVGLSIVHVNRTLQELRSSDLIVLDGKRLSIPDVARLQNFALFSPDYLYIGAERRPGRHLAADASADVQPAL